MPNINAFRPVVHEKIFKGVCYINLYENYVPLGRCHYKPQGLHLNFNVLFLKRSMPNIIRLRPVVHENKIFKSVYYTSLYNIMSP